MRRGITHNRRALRRSLLRLAWRVNPSLWGEDSLKHAHASRHLVAVDLLLDGERPEIQEGFVRLGDKHLVRAIEPAINAVAAVLESIGRELATFAVDGIALADLSERLVNIERSAVTAEPTESPPAGIRSVAALCDAPRPGPMAALAA